MTCPIYSPLPLRGSKSCSPAPSPIVCTVTLQEFVACAVRIADFPKLLTIAHGLPFQFTQVGRLAGCNRYVRLGKLSQHPVGKRVQRVVAGSDIGYGERAVFISVGPELTVVPIGGPGDGFAIACPPLVFAAVTRIVGMSQSHGEIRQLCRRCLWIVENELAHDRAAFIFLWIVHAVDPIIQPLRFFDFCPVQRILPERRAIRRPRRRDNRISLSRFQFVQVGWRRIRGILERVAININWPDDLDSGFPLPECCNTGHPRSGRWSNSPNDKPSYARRDPAFPRRHQCIPCSD
jgi:hypothetical protein